MSEQQKCQRPGCPGSYEDVGGGELYCDTCGLAPVVASNGMVGSPRPDSPRAARARAAPAAVRGRVPAAPVPVRPRAPRSRGARSPDACRARCPATRPAARCRCAARARPPPPVAAVSSASGWCRCRTCRGPTRARWCWRTRRCPSASGSARAPTAGRRWAVRAVSGWGAPRGSAPSAVTRTRSCRSCTRATSCTASTRWWAVSRTAGSAGSTSPSTARSPTAGWSSRVCSTPATRTRWRRRSPSGASWRRSSTPTSCGSTTSWSTWTSGRVRWTGTSSWSTSAASR